MIRVFGAILITAVVLVVTYIRIGGSFDKTFWLNFIPGVMTNVAAMVIAIFVVEAIQKREHQAKLIATNAEQSRFVRLLNDKMTFHVLKYLGLATDQEFSDDRALDFAFALEKLRVLDLSEEYYKKLMLSQDREAFIKGFVEILSGHAAPVYEALSKIYPRPDPELNDGGKLSRAAGMIDAMAILPSAYKESNETLPEKDRLKPEQVDLLFKVGYPPIRRAIQDFQNATVRLSDRARANRLFMALD